MKIYFSGSHAVGKSTLARYVSQTYNLPMITETARMILSEQELQIDTLRHDLEVADKYQQQVFDRQILEEQKHSSFVSDRSIIDVLAYSTQHTRILADLLSSPELTACVDNLKLSSTAIFFVRPSKATLKADGVREVINWDAAVAIDAIIKTFLQMFNLKYFQIDTDSMQERVRLIDNILAILKI
jgi:predicted ATPase